MNLTQLRAFYEVARHGSFTGAAKAMHLTQPGLSGHVRSLEETYGVELFFRQARQVSLTPTGQELFVTAEEIFRLSEEADAQLKMTSSKIAGVLRVGSDNPYRSIPCLSQFTRTHSDVDLDLRFGNGAQVVADLRNCVVDLAFVAQADGLKSLHTVRRGRQPIDVVVAKSHPWKKKKSVSLLELRSQTWLRRESGSKTQEAVDQLFSKKRIRPKLSMQIDGREALREAIANDIGIGLICRAEYEHDPRLHGLNIRDHELYLTEYVACLESRKDVPVIRCALEFAVKGSD